MCPEEALNRMLPVAFVLSAALGSSAQAPQRPANAAPAGNADEGKKLFVSDQ